jgi:predicted SPOUT superfamily RNA methylase MTH1
LKPCSSSYKTVSIAIGASCIENAQSQDLGTLLAGQLARAAAIFNIDEIVVLDDGPKHGDNQISAAAALFARVLQFMETPQYLRKALIPMHPDLKFAGMLPPLDAPHHMRSNEWCEYREGVVWGFDEGLKESIIDIGLDKNAVVDSKLPTGARVTLNVGAQEQAVCLGETQYLRAQIANPLDPKAKINKYWGYTTRIAKNLDDLFGQSPFQGGYDLTIGTSERGEEASCCSLSFPEYQHALIVIGGPQGLEYCLQNDPKRSEHSEPSTLFDRYLNVCPDQGSRTIRTEEALLILLTFLKPGLGRG